MDRKNKVMLIAAAGAVAILIASALVRCAAPRAGAGDPADEPAPAAQAAQTAGEQARSEEEAVLAILTEHRWQARDDSSRTIAFRDGTFIETDGETSRVTAYEAVSASEAPGASSLDVRTVRDGAEAEESTTISISGGEGSYSVSCDGFQNSGTYVQASSSEDPVAVTGLAEPYTTLIDGKTDELASEVASWCREHAPTATKAAFEGEVYVDTKDGRVGATFRCDDAARTVISVTYAGGEFSIAG